MSYIKTLTASPCLIILTLTLTLTLTQQSHAQNAPQDYVDAHITAREAVGVGPIEWNVEVAAYAQQYADKRAGDCALQHSDGPYGENITWGSGSGDYGLTGTQAVQLWVDEKANYDYNSNTCAEGKVCGHYTQVVWRNSVRLGCARVECDDKKGTFITCNYDPPGNIVGQRPY